MDVAHQAKMEESIKKYKEKWRKRPLEASTVDITSGRVPTAEEIEEALQGKRPIYFGLGSIIVKLDGNAFDVRYFSRDERGRIKLKVIFDQELGDIVNDPELDDIITKRFQEGKFRIFGSTEDGHKKISGWTIPDVTRKQKKLSAEVLNMVRKDGDKTSDLMEVTSDLESSRLQQQDELFKE